MAKKLLYLLLAISLGVNAGLVVVTLYHRGEPALPAGQMGPPPGGPQGGPGGPGGGARQPDPRQLVDGHVQGITRHLDLDEEQQQQIRTALEGFAPELVAMQMRVTEAGRRLSTAFADPDFDSEMFRRLTAETGAARSALDSLSSEILVAEAAVLTPEQRVKYAEVAPIVHSQPQRGPQKPQGAQGQKGQKERRPPR